MSKEREGELHTDGFSLPFIKGRSRQVAFMINGVWRERHLRIKMVPIRLKCPARSQ